MSDTEVDTVEDDEQWTITDLIGGGYDEVMSCRLRYIPIRGSRASKKSYTVAYKIILSMIQYPELNVLCVRKVYGTLRDSCFALLKKLIRYIGYQRYFQFTTNPLEIRFLPTGQKILFRGLDDPEKLSSIQVDTGILCWAWIEEAYQLTTLRDFQLVDQVIRGATPKHLYKQILMTFNPWNRSSWLRTEFFETEDGHPLNRPDTLAMVTTYKINEWLDAKDLEFFENMKIQNPQLYEVAGLGNWGNPEGLIFNNWEEKDFDIEAVRKMEGVQAIYGLDFGWEDPCAFSFTLVRQSTMEMWVCDDQPYASHMDPEVLAKEITERGYRKKNIICDSAQPGDINALKNKYNIPNAIGCVKYPGSVLTQIRRLQGYRIYVHPKCVNAITEFQTLAWKVDKDGHTLEVEAPFCPNHFVASLRYATESIDQGNGIFLAEIGGTAERQVVDDMSTPPSERKSNKEMGTHKSEPPGSGATATEDDTEEEDDGDDDDEESSLCYSL